MPGQDECLHIKDDVVYESRRLQYIFTIFMKKKKKKMDRKAVHGRHQKKKYTQVLA